MTGQAAKRTMEAVSRLRWKRGLWRIWALCAVATAALCAWASFSEYQRELRAAARLAPTPEQIEQACLSEVAHLRRNGLPDPEDGPFGQYFAMKAQEEYGHILSMPESDAREACAKKGRAEGVSLRKVTKPSIITASLIALMWFVLIAIAAPAAIAMTAAATYIAARWVVRGFSP